MDHATGWTILLLFLGTVSSIPVEDYLPGPKSYSGYSVLRTAPIHGEATLASLMSLDGARGVRFWKYPLLNASSDILASPTRLAHVQSLLDSLGLQHSILISDVETLLQEEQLYQDIPTTYGKDGSVEEEDPSTRNTAFFQRYQSYDGE